VLFEVIFMYKTFDFKRFSQL